MKWFTYCLMCQKVVGEEDGIDDRWMAEADALIHRIDNPNHQVLVGYTVSERGLGVDVHEHS